MSSTAAVRGQPSNEVVVLVGKNSITRGALEHWMAIGAPIKKEVPDPPSYSSCIAHLQATAAKSGAAGNTSTTAKLKSECEQRYRELEQPALHTLIDGYALIDEAGELGLRVTDAEVKRILEQTVRQEFPNEAEFQKYLKSSGETASDILFNFKVTQAAEKIRAMIKDKVRNGAPASIVSYYKAHKSSFDVPERRDIRAIRTWTKAAITRAEREVRSGKSFGDVAKRISVDRPSNEHGGVTLGVVRGQEEKGYDEAIFAAKPHVLVGPLYLRKRYYVFEVTKAIPGHRESLGTLGAAVKKQLLVGAQEQALADFIKSWREKWTAKTSCRPGYVVPRCRQYVVSAATPAEDAYTF